MARISLSLICSFLVASNCISIPRVWVADEDGFGEWVDLTTNLDFSMKPAFDPTDSVHLYLYTSSNPATPFELKSGDTSVGNFDPSKTTRVISHGWHSSADKMSDLRDAYLSAGEYNLVMIDWSERAILPYTEAILDVPVIGEYAGALINQQLIQLGGGSVKNIQLIGHSLGAHVSGVIGRSLGNQVERINGLDPALPLYNLVDNENKLDSSDALEVQVIHTCGGMLGYYDPVGTVDFYPNGGSKPQPGCGLDLTGSCSHSRSHQYFKESILGGPFFGNQCENMDAMKEGNCNGPSLLMGEFMPAGSTGIYYLETNSESPYAQG